MTTTSSSSPKLSPFNPVIVFNGSLCPRNDFKERATTEEWGSTRDSTTVPPVTENVALPGKTSPAESIPVRVLPPIPERAARALQVDAGRRGK
ncbi:hypothetical protein HPP92_007445 [Vanilla planifolia]|uniref:Uncharacterized protein n=1 Tax=Vanilla planifolia TaxID=51239 RepID=A0A835V9M2_VANPL|nr:hypothetical protein HPP92_007445 [Vanilla planifolia]